jgi:phosphoglycolate phosphatase
VIWDWNGTIVNDAYLFVDIMNQTLSKQGLPKITLDDYKNSFCFPIEKYWKSLGFKFTSVEFETMNSHFIQLYKARMEEPCLHKNIAAVFDAYKKLGIKQFVLSASEHHMLRGLVTNYKIAHYFTDIVGVDNLNAQGKVPLAKKLLIKHGLSSSETLLIGDTQYDARVASAIHCRLALVSFGHFSKERLSDAADIVFDSVDDIINYLS